jgi:hypothetical protein
VTHKRASKFVAEAGFTAPVSREGQSRLWDRREVVAWANGVRSRAGAAISDRGPHRSLKP